MRCFSPSPCFYIILVQVSLGFICWFLTQLNLTSLFLSVTSGLNFVINPVFDFVKASLDCGLWQWYTCLLKSVLGLTRCCKGFLLPIFYLFVMELQRNRPLLSMKLFFQSVYCFWDSELKLKIYTSITSWLFDLLSTVVFNKVNLCHYKSIFSSTEWNYLLNGKCHFLQWPWSLYHCFYLSSACSCYLPELPAHYK